MFSDAFFLIEPSLASILFSTDFNICYLLFLFLILKTNNYKDSSYSKPKSGTNKIPIIPYQLLLYYLLLFLNLLYFFL